MLAQAVEVDRKTIARWEQGGLIPAGDTVHQLAEALEISALWLMGYTDNPDKMVQLREDEKLVLARYNAVEPDLRPQAVELLGKLAGRS